MTSAAGPSTAAAGYRAVLLQQGRVLLDADCNEQTADHRPPRRGPHARRRRARRRPGGRRRLRARRRRRQPRPAAPRGRICASRRGASTSTACSPRPRRSTGRRGIGSRAQPYLPEDIRSCRASRSRRTTAATPSCSTSGRTTSRPTRRRGCSSPRSAAPTRRPGRRPSGRCALHRSARRTSVRRGTRRGVPARAAADDDRVAGGRRRRAPTRAEITTAAGYRRLENQLYRVADPRGRRHRRGDATCGRARTAASSPG